MSSIDTRVVDMQFNNEEFQRRSADTLKSLDALNKGMKLDGATKGLQELGAAGKVVGAGVGHVEHAVDAVAGKIKAMGVIGVTALATITHQAITTGTQLVKSLTIDPLKLGFQEYETNLNSIQTILANTGLEGAAGLKRVTDALDELNHYSDQTIYNFSEMARNIGTFTAAGVKLDVATAAIKGIANLAAVSGSNSQQASAAMYQLSQALAAGKLTLIDWNSVVNAGMGGKVFQDALIETARVHGVAIDRMIKDAGSFRASLEKGWITDEILTETLSKFTGDLTAQQLKSMGYNEQQIAGILKMGKVAQDAATKVKTATQLINTLQEGVVSGWAKTWQMIIGDFDEAREMFTAINDVIGGFINKSSDARNKVVADWKELGGRKVLITAVSDAFKALIAVVTPIKDAFREIFPATTGKQLYDITVAVGNFARSLKISADTGMNIRRTFAGLFALLDIGWMIIKEGVKFFFELFGVVTEGSGGILEFTGDIGDFIVALRNAIKTGGGIRKFFEILGRVLKPPIQFLKSVASLIGGLFDGFDGKGAADKILGFLGRIASLENAGQRIEAVWKGVFGFLTKVFTNFFETARKANEILQGLGSNTSTALQGFDLNKIFAGLATGAFASFIFALRGFVTSASNVIEGLTDSLGAMQNTLRAATLLQIALAVGVLAVAVKVLSELNAEQLGVSLTAITAMFIQLMAAMLIFEKLSGFKGFAKMPFIAASMILLSAAIVVLSHAVKNLADLEWEELGRGLSGVAGLLALVVATVQLMPPSKGLITTGVALLILGGAIHVLVGAVTDLAAMNWEELAKGLVGVGTLLAALTLFTRFTQANALGILSGAGILLLAVAIHLLVDSVKSFAEMSWGEIGKGLTVLAGALLAIGVAISLIPPTSVFSAAGVLLVATSLGMIADALDQMSGMSWGEIGKGLTVMAGALAAVGAALFFIPPTAALSAEGVVRAANGLKIIGEALKSMAQMSWEDIAKGLVTLGGSLLLITIALQAMSGALLGAAALFVVAGALAVLAPVLIAFSKLTWGEIAAGLAMLAGVFVVLGVAGTLITPVVVTLLLLSAAIMGIGLGIGLAAVGIFLMATALTTLAVAGAAGTTALVAMVGALAGLIPEVVKQIGLGLVAVMEVLATAQPTMIKTLVAILRSLIGAIREVAPEIFETVYELVEKLLFIILEHTPEFTDTGLKIVVAFLNGVADNIEDVVAAATRLAIKFLDAIEKERPKLIQKGVDYVIGFINGIADAIRNNSKKMQDAALNLAQAIIEGLVSGLLSGQSRVIGKIVDIAKGALNAAKNALGISSPSKEFALVGRYSAEGIAVGMQNYSELVEASAEDLAFMALESMRSVLSTMSTAIEEEVGDPVIRPVLDLTNLRKGAQDANNILGSSLISSTTTASANDAAALFRRFPPPEPDGGSSPQAPVVYNQYNNSPKPLDPAEIYRQTKNQLSTTRKGVSP